MKEFIRNFRRQKIVGLFAIISLGLGTMTTIIIGLWSIDEFTFDNFQKNGDKMYRFTGSSNINNQTTRSIGGDGIDLVRENKLLDNYPEVDEYFGMTIFDQDITVADKKYMAIPTILADKNFFTFFTFPLKSGDPEKVISEPGKAVIDEKTAIMMFPGEDPVGKTITIFEKKHKETCNYLKNKNIKSFGIE